MPSDQIQYSEKYNDDKYEYRYVIFIFGLQVLFSKMSKAQENK